MHRYCAVYFFIACALLGVSIAFNCYLVDRLTARELACPQAPAANVMQLDPETIYVKPPGGDVYEL